MDEPKLDKVVMPVILVMNDPNLSWTQRQTCANAVQESLKCYRKLMEPSDDEQLEEKPSPKRGGR